mmetsp:Transcript_561/g.1761  ORF Transcript_561/g.1761 Transcript_561/m.1761 type:complete len:330 (-) Transcript_561:147-1136(-)
MPSLASVLLAARQERGNVDPWKRQVGINTVVWQRHEGEASTQVPRVEPREGEAQSVAAEGRGRGGISALCARAPREAEVPYPVADIKGNATREVADAHGHAVVVGADDHVDGPRLQVSRRVRERGQGSRTAAVLEHLQQDVVQVNGDVGEGVCAALPDLDLHDWPDARVVHAELPRGFHRALADRGGVALGVHDAGDGRAAARQLHHDCDVLGGEHLRANARGQELREPVRPEEAVRAAHGRAAPVERLANQRQGLALALLEPAHNLREAAQVLRDLGHAHLPEGLGIAPMEVREVRVAAPVLQLLDLPEPRREVFGDLRVDLQRGVAR